MTAIPDKFLDLVTKKKAFANLATVMPDGSPQVTPVWIDYADGLLRVNAAKGRTKARNMKTGARVALSILDPDNPYRHLAVRGRVKRMTEQGADAHIDALAKKHRTTAFVDMYYFEDRVAQAAKEAGLRGVLGETILRFKSPDSATPPARVTSAGR